jgi:hypothetical protein
MEPELTLELELELQLELELLEDMIAKKSIEYIL